MNATMCMGFQQPAVNNVAAANTKNIAKNAPQSADSNSDAPQKNFDEIFQDISSEAEGKVDAAPEKAVDQMPGFSGMNNIVVLVDVSAIPVIQIEAEAEMPAPNVNATPDQSGLTSAANATTAQVGFADLLQNVKNPNLIQPSTQRENAQDTEIPMVQNNANTAETILTEQALLNLLNGKNMKSAAVLAQMQKQQQVPVQNQPQMQMVNQQQVPVQSQLQMQMVNQQQVPVQSQAQMQMVNQQQAILQEQAQAQISNPPVVEAAQEQVQLPVQPLIEAPLQTVSKPLKDKAADKPLPAVQNVNLLIEQDSQPKGGQLNAVGVEEKAAPESTLLPLPNKNEAALKSATIENANKGIESTHAQQFGQFVTNAVQARTESASPAQPTLPQTPDSLAKYDIHGQIIEQARLVKSSENTQMIIKLRPEHLGELTLKVSVEHGVVNATFHSDNAQVRTMLETTLLQLKQELISQGIKVDNVGVYAGLGQFLSDGQGSQNGREQQSAKFKNRKIDLADFEDEVDKVSGLRTTNTATEDGVDYRI